jgi:cellulose biosynthesis protein BcsQ
VKPKLKRRARGFSKAGKPVEASIKGTNYENLDLLPADFTHRNLDIVFDGLKRPKQRLRKVLEPFAQEYDLILLDCPPTIFLKENVYKPERAYVFCSMIDRRKKMHRETMATLQNRFDRVLDSAIPSLSEVEQMGVYREPVAVFAPRSAAAAAYHRLWVEVQETLP